MTRWDVARRDLVCYRCGGPIVAGEQFRQFGPKNLPVCIVDAKRATGEDPPADMPEQPLVPKLKEPAAWHEPKRTMQPIQSVMPTLESAQQLEHFLRGQRQGEGDR